MPVQNDWGWNVMPMHDIAVPHGTVEAVCWQAPPPLQAPVLPHGADADVGHCPGGAAAPLAMFAHMPRLPRMLQAWHVGQLALPQQ